MNKKLIKLLTIISFFFILAFKTFASQSFASQSYFPRGCEPIGFEFQDNDIVLNQPKEQSMCYELLPP